MAGTAAGVHQRSGVRATTRTLGRDAVLQFLLRWQDWGSRITWYSAALVAAYSVFYVSGVGTPDQRIFVTDLVYLPLSVAAVVAGVRVARSRFLDPCTRRAWMLITAAFACGGFGNVAWFWLEAVTGSLSIVSVADIGYLSFFPMMLAGLLMLPTRRHNRRERARLGMDIVTVMTGGFMLVWYFVLGPTITQGSVEPLDAVIANAYPIGDLVVLFGVVTLFLRGPAPRSRRSLQFLLLGVAMFVVADVFYGYASLHGGFVSGSWADLFWLTTWVLFIAGASDQYYRATHRLPETVGRRNVQTMSWLPYGAIAVGYGLLLIIARGEQLYPMGGMVLAAVVLTAAVVMRQLNVLRENRQLAVTDPLTGIANRTLLQASLDKAIARSRRTHDPVGVLLLDLDGFKQVNDTMGHEAGDAILRSVADVLRSAARASDTAGRLGGDEFAIILDDVGDLKSAAHVAERVLRRLQSPVTFGGHDLAVKASVGIALSDPGTTSASDLLHFADMAMYTAKKRGTGGYEIYTPGMDAVTLESELRAALEEGAFDLRYQPIVNLETGAVDSVEALVRWLHPTRGILLPDQFIPLAEETRLIVPLGNWVLRRACEQMQIWHELVPGSRDVTLSVNLSPRQVQHTAFVGDVTAILEQTGLDPHRLVLELTEARLIPHDATTVNRLMTLKRLGVRLAIDDFGSGFSSLSYLSKLPIDILKIDQVYIAGLTGRAETETTFSEAVVKLGQTLDLLTVAEGIETGEQLARLRKLGCPLGQGFYLAIPLDIDEIEFMLGERPESAVSAFTAHPSTRNLGWFGPAPSTA